jgi:uncharacterized membrane protein
MKHKIKNQAQSVVFLFVGLIFFFGSCALSLVTLANIGPGFIPTVFSVMLMIIAVAIYFQKSSHD